MKIENGNLELEPYEILYIKYKENNEWKYNCYENEDSVLFISFEDFVNNFIDCGYNDFEIYASCSNMGYYGLLTTVENGTIIYIESDYNYLE